MNIATPFITHTQSAGLMQPSKRTFYNPACLAQSASIFSSAFGQQRFDIHSSQCEPMRLRIVPSITLNDIGSFYRPTFFAGYFRNGLHQIKKLRDIVAIRTGNDGGKRNSICIGNHMMLTAFFPPICWVWACFLPPKTARTDAESTTARDKSILSILRKWLSSAWCMLFHTPAFCQSRRRRQQVMPEPQPISCGRYSQPIPVFRTKSMPVNAARSETGLRPGYWNRRFRCGMCGSMIFHNSSSSIGLAISNLHVIFKGLHGRIIPVISKIEKPEAVTNLQEIMDESSVIMVARGDLGVEAPAEEVPLMQKAIIRSCIDRGLPVITATQMLESMMHNPKPTRAETNDVANAVLDGTSAVMLSGETAAGEYPLQAVTIMSRIASLTERSDVFQKQVFNQISMLDPERKITTTEAVGLATRELSLSVGATFIACFTQTGSTARLIAKFRPSVPIIAFSPLPEVVTYLAMSWGVTPILIDQLASVDELLAYAPTYLQKQGLVQQGDTVVITAGVPVGSSGKTNMIKVVEIE